MPSIVAYEIMHMKMPRGETPLATKQQQSQYKPKSHSIIIQNHEQKRKIL